MGGSVGAGWRSGDRGSRWIRLFAPGGGSRTLRPMIRPELPPETDFRFSTHRSTRWSDEDNQRVVNNAVYMTLLEEARHQYFGELGLLVENQFPFVLAQTNIRFVAPGSGGCELRIDLRTTALGTSSFTQVYRISEREGGRLLVEAEAALVCWDNARRTKAPLAAAFRCAVADFEGLEGSTPA